MLHKTKILSVLLSSFFILTIGTESDENDSFWESEEFAVSKISGLRRKVSIRVYQDKHLEGLNQVINIPKCKAKLPSPFLKNISSLLAFDVCVNLYKNENCTGDHIVLTEMMGPFHELLNWGDFNKNVSSIGSCYPPCHAEDKEIQPHNKSTSITLYSYPYFKGYNDDLEIKDCSPIPKRFNGRIQSISMHEQTCIEIHEFWDCTGKSIVLQKGSPFFYTLKHLFYRFMNMGAISHCGYNCTTRETKNISEIPNGPNHVRIYDMAGFKGIFKDLTFGSGCLDISDAWEGQAMSIKTYWKCVTIFELNNCNQTGNFLDLNDSNYEIHKNLTTGNFDRLIRSIKLCDSKIVAENHENLIHVSNSKVTLVIYLLVAFSLIGLLGLVVAVVLFKKNNRKDLERRRNANEVTVFPQAWGNSESDSTNLL